MLSPCYSWPSLSQNTSYFFIFSNEANNTFTSFWSGAEEDYLPDLLLTISSCSDDTNPFSTTDKELVTTFLSLQQSANLLPKNAFTFSRNHFSYMKISIKIKTHVQKSITTYDQVEIDLPCSSAFLYCAHNQ